MCATDRVTSSRTTFWFSDSLILTLSHALSHAQKWQHFYFRSETCCHCRPQWRRLSISEHKFCQFVIAFGEFWPYFHWAYAEIAIYELKPPFDSTTPSSNSLREAHFGDWMTFAEFLSRVSILLLTRDIDIVILSVGPSVRPSVRLSVTRWYCMKTA